MAIFSKRSLYAVHDILHAVHDILHAVHDILHAVHDKLWITVVKILI